MTLPLRAAALLVALASSTAATAGVAQAHGSFDSNLAAQTFEQAPATADFTAEVPVLLDTAEAQLRYLGTGEVSADSYFAKDVPTVTLELVGAAEGIAESFAFKLPRLGAGSYALDWEVTPQGDHATQSVQLFEVTVGVPNPDPSPPVPTVADDTLSPSAAKQDAGASSSAFPIFLGTMFLLVVSGVIVAVVRGRKGKQG